MRETLQPIAKILEEAGQFEPGGMVMREWVGVSGSSAAREAFVELLEKSPAGLECALDFVLDTKRHWFRRHKLDRGTFDRAVALATEDHRRAAVVRVSLRGHGIGGRLPAELGRLTNLTELNMAECGLDGTLVSDPFNSASSEMRSRAQGRRSTRRCGCSYRSRRRSRRSTSAATSLAARLRTILHRS